MGMGGNGIEKDIPAHLYSIHAMWHAYIRRVEVGKQQDALHWHQQYKRI